jgi:hypothetical protein
MSVRTVAQLVSLVAFAGTILPAILFFSGAVGLDAVKTAMPVATIAWFVATPLWMGRAHPQPVGDGPSSRDPGGNRP